MQLKQFLDVARKLCKSQKFMRIEIGEPAPGEKIYLVYCKEKNTLTIRDEGDKELSVRLQNKLFPAALGILAQVYLNQEQKKSERYAKKESTI